MIAEFDWLYRNDKLWLLEHLPPAQPAVMNLKRGADWKKRDNDLSKLIPSAVNSIKEAPGKPVRITGKGIAKLIAQCVLPRSALEKLPKTKAAIEAVAESLEDFHIRKVHFASEQILKKGSPLRRWEIVGTAGLNGRCSARVSEEIDKIIRGLSDALSRIPLSERKHT
jgi:hypothetical protein